MRTPIIFSARRPLRLDLGRILPLAIALVAVSGFAFLPVIVHGYTYPPGDDPVGLQNILDLRRHNYYGHLPAIILGMTFYYYLTPIFVFAGCYILLIRYGFATVCLTWLALFLLCRTLLFDLHSGTFVGLINFYFLGFLLFRLMARAVEQGKPLWPTALMATSLVLFHAFTGLLLWVGVASHAAIFRFKFVIAAGVFLSAGVLFSAVYLDSSIARLMFWISMISTSTEGVPFIAAMPFASVEHDALTWGKFGKQYVGEMLWIYWGIAAISAKFAHSNGWKPPRDVALIALALIVVPLAIMTFSPLAINADRTAKMLVGIVTLFASFGLGQSLVHFNNWRLSGIMGVTLLFIGFSTAIPNIEYWLTSGSYR